MASFEAALPTLLFHEGGFVDHKSDPGGATNWGVSLRWVKSQHVDLDVDHDGDIDADDIRQLSQVQAANLYKCFWWDKNGYGQIQDQQVATKLLDLAVNMGSPQAHKILQRAICCCKQKVDIDGAIGLKTITAANACDSVCLLFHLRDQAAAFYQALATRKPSMAVFLKGWLRRAYS